MVQGVTTEWEDLQVKQGNWKPVEKPPSNDQVFYQEINDLEYYNPLANMNEKQLAEKAEEDLDFDDDDDFYKDYKEKRLQQL